MGTKQLNFSGRELPSYIGFGLLDENSINFDNDIVTAEYLLECDKTIVHRINWDKTRCELKTFFHSDSCGTSWYPDLKQSIMSDFFFRDFSKDKIFDFLIEVICKTGNIYVQKPEPKDKGTHTVFYPAGLLMCFRLPIIEKNKAYLEFLEQIRIEGHINFFRELKSIILLEGKHGTITTQPIMIADFIVPLAFVTVAARIFVEKALIQPSKILRMMVDDSSKVQTNFMQTFVGDSIYPYFAVCFKDVPSAGITKIFEETIKGLKLITK